MQATTSYSQTRNKNNAIRKPMINRELLFSRVLKPTVFILLLLPVLSLAWGVSQDTLGANPVEAVIRGLGDWGLRILLLTLLVSPLRRLLNMPRLLRFRRMLGLFAFFYVSLHLLGYLWLEQSLDWQEIWLDIVERPFITVGMLAFVLLIPLTLTSTKGMIRRLGKNWKRLHRLVYPISILAIVHFFWMVKLDITEPVIYAFLLFLLLTERLYRKFL
jgi:sulfoxide reductase heme-binding subunit YedZ